VNSADCIACDILFSSISSVITRLYYVSAALLNRSSNSNVRQLRFVTNVEVECMIFRITVYITRNMFLPALKSPLTDSIMAQRFSPFLPVVVKTPVRLFSRSLCHRSRLRFGAFDFFTFVTWNVLVLVFERMPL
jgi:hypothetical protein